MQGLMLIRSYLPRHHSFMEYLELMQVFTILLYYKLLPIAYSSKPWRYWIHLSVALKSFDGRKTSQDYFVCSNSAQQYA